MNIDKICSNDLIVYCYAKDLDSLNIQKNSINIFCKDTSKTPTKFYVDYGVSNFLRNKNNLQKLLSNNENIDLLVFSQDRLTRDTKEMLSISSICKDKNIRIFGIKENELLLQNSTNELMLDVISKIKNNSKDDLEL